MLRLTDRVEEPTVTPVRARAMAAVAPRAGSVVTLQHTAAPAATQPLGPAQRPLPTSRQMAAAEAMARSAKARRSETAARPATSVVTATRIAARAASWTLAAVLPDPLASVLMAPAAARTARRAQAPALGIAALPATSAEAVTPIAAQAANRASAAALSDLLAPAPMVPAARTARRARALGLETAALPAATAEPHQLIVVQVARARTAHADQARVLSRPMDLAGPRMGRPA